MRPTFQDRAAFRAGDTFELLPHRVAALPGSAKVMLATDGGDYCFLTDNEYRALQSGTLRGDRLDDMYAKHIVASGPASRRLTEAKIRTRKAFLREGPALHIFVVTLRCDHGCPYCQVSRRGEGCDAYDMTDEAADASVDRIFESSARHLTVEFQGGEPLLASSRIRQIVERIEARNAHEARTITYTITSTLHHLTDDILDFFRRHRFQVSTSLDGPAVLHDANRPIPSRDGHRRTVSGIARAREALGHDAVSALTTLTRASLDEPQAIIDEYVRLGFRSIFLRPLSPYGFATRSERRIGYPMQDFVRFYERALDYLLKLNRHGAEIAEVYAGILLGHMLTPYHSGYVDLRSPAGAGLGALVHNYDGNVYASDEGRMLAEMGDTTFRLGTVDTPLGALLSSAGMAAVIRRSIAEELTPCSDCAFVPYCGADPVMAHATGARMDAPAAAHCERHLGLFQILARLLDEGDPDTIRILTAWALRRAPHELRHEVSA